MHVVNLPFILSSINLGAPWVALKYAVTIIYTWLRTFQSCVQGDAGYQDVIESASSLAKVCDIQGDRYVNLIYIPA